MREITKDFGGINLLALSNPLGNKKKSIKNSCYIAEVFILFEKDVCELSLHGKTQIYLLLINLYVSEVKYSSVVPNIHNSPSEI